MNKTYLRGDMYYADLGRGIGSEQEGYRPVVIIQNNTGNKYSPTVIVAAISSKVDAKAKLPTHYLLKAESGLELPSLVLLEQLRTCLLYTSILWIMQSLTIKLELEKPLRGILLKRHICRP